MEPIESCHVDCENCHATDCMDKWKIKLQSVTLAHKQAINEGDMEMATFYSGMIQVLREITGWKP